MTIDQAAIVRPLGERTPQIDDGAFVAAGAVVVGDVVLAAGRKRLVQLGAASGESAHHRW